jgi:hypothetical protein
MWVLSINDRIWILKFTTVPGWPWSVDWPQHPGLLHDRAEPQPQDESLLHCKLVEWTSALECCKEFLSKMSVCEVFTSMWSFYLDVKFLPRWIFTLMCSFYLDLKFLLWCEVFTLIWSFYLDVKFFILVWRCEDFTLVWSYTLK